MLESSSYILVDFVKWFLSNARLVVGLLDTDVNSQGYGSWYIGVTSGGDCTKNGFL